MEFDFFSRYKALYLHEEEGGVKKGGEQENVVRWWVGG